MIIWDPNRREDARFRPTGLGAQQSLIDAIRKTDRKLEDVWIRGCGNTDNRFCMQLSLNFVHLKGGAQGSLPRLEEMKEAGFFKLHGIPRSRFRGA